MKKKHFIPFLILILFWGCGCKKKIDREVSFYHWKSKFKLGEKEVDYLSSLNVKKLYVRFFDVKWIESEKDAFPIAVLNNETYQLENITEIVPVVFITNETLQESNNKQIEELAKNIYKKVDNIAYYMRQKFVVDEIQIDCDWTLSTKDKYFDLLEKIKEKSENFKKISATIRLHQIKYFKKTGVPPVNSGVLMFYNMGNLSNTEETNSILNLKTAKKYLKNINKYPLELDVALPLFNWGVQFRDDKVISLINNLSLDELKQHEKFVEIEERKFKVKESTYINGSYVYKGDIIRVEMINPDQLKEAVSILDKAFRSKDFSIVFYHLDEKIIENYSEKLIKEIVKK